MVTSGGQDMGCMKLVGEAFKENSFKFDESKQVVVLAISNWRTIRGKEILKNENVNTTLYFAIF